MIIQISSGQGPAECELAVCLLYKSLRQEYPDIKELSVHKSKFSDCYTSASTAERSQLLNKKDALEKLAALLKDKQAEQLKLQINAAWQEHNKIVRDNLVRTYKDLNFKFQTYKRTGRTNKRTDSLRLVIAIL